jgi:hypothetical protein
VKPNELRLSNLIALAYDPERYGVIIAMDISDSNQLGNKEAADHVRDIVGIQITENLFEKLGYETTIFTQDDEITLEFIDKKVTVTIDG